MDASTPLRPNFPIRSLQEEKSYEEAKQALKSSCQEVDRVLAGVDGTIGRNPEAYPVVDDRSGWRMVKTNRVANIPSFYIYYTFDAEKLYLHFIEEVDDGNASD